MIIKTIPNWETLATVDGILDGTLPQVPTAFQAIVTLLITTSLHFFFFLPQFGTCLHDTVKKE